LGTKLSSEIVLKDNDEAIRLLGRNGEIRKRIQSEMGVKIVDRGEKLLVLGAPEEVAKAKGVLSEMLAAVRNGRGVSVSDVDCALNLGNKDGVENLRSSFETIIPVAKKGKTVRARTRGQQRYVEAMRGHDITFSIGPAGTGKTYLAMAMAIASLQSRKVERLILTRPAVEAGESLGYLPGDIEEKVNPYLRPLYDALYDMMPRSEVFRCMEKDMIEVAPLAFMRGRTLNNAFVILDEAQNTSPQQMKMFLTRLGQNSHTVVTGDITQIDLPEGQTSGLIHARDILDGTRGIAFAYLTPEDVVRHRLVKEIIEAYEKHDSGQVRSNGEEEQEQE